MFSCGIMGDGRFYYKLAVVRVELAKGGIVVSVVEDFLVREYVVSIVINGVEIRRYIISKDMVEEFVLGNLYSMGLVRDLSEIEDLVVSENRVNVKVVPEVLKRASVLTIAPSCGEQVVPEEQAQLIVKSDVKIRVEKVFEAINQLFMRSRVFRITGGVHVASLYDLEGSETLVAVEDLGRHSTVDKVIGWGLLRNIDFSKVAIVTSGRVFSDMVSKAVRVRVPLIISKSAPSYEAVLKARKHSVTLVGFVRGNRFNVYSEPYRIVGLEKVKLG